MAINIITIRFAYQYENLRYKCSYSDAQAAEIKMHKKW